MASKVRIKNLSSEFLYEFSRSTTPTDWTAQTIADNGTIDLPDYGSDRVLIRVTADEPKFGSVAYQLEVLVTYPGGSSYGDREIVTLNVPDGTGTFRTDSITTTIFGSTVTATRALVESGSYQDLFAYDQQIQLERELGVVFEYARRKYRGTSTSRVDAKALDAGGYLESFDLVVTTSRKQWVDAGTTPILGASIKLAGVTYRIASITVNAGHYELALNKHRGN